MNNMKKSYWIISPNVHNNASEQRWKEVIAERRNVYIGFGPNESTGVTFYNQVKEGDVILVAQGANRNKQSYLCGIVNSPAIAGEEHGTPGYAQRRSLIHTLDEQELVALQLDFNGCAYKDADRIPALYKLKPWENTNDQRISTEIMTVINQKIKDELMSKIKLSEEDQKQIKTLWTRFKKEAKEEDKNEEVKRLIDKWGEYKVKIIDETFGLDDYTNTLANSSKDLSGGYLCNFLERTTRKILGSSKPGSASNFEVKLNKDAKTYCIKRDNNNDATKPEAEEFFTEKIKGLLKKIVEETDLLVKISLVENATNYSAKQILMKLAVLDNLTDFIYIYSSQWLDTLYGIFVDGDAEGDFTKNHHVCLVTKKLLKVNEEDKGELILLSQFLWKYVNTKSIADSDNPNVIMYGPPGTGKTYSVDNSLDFVCQGDSSRYERLQFHPSFTYEDFIEGIKPKGVSEDGNIRFELVNGVFKNFCIRAKKNLEENKETPEKIKPFYFVVDEINRANLSTVFGETLSLLEKNYRHDGASNRNLLRTQYSTLIEDLIKEDDKYKDLAYTIDNGEVKFGVPKNIFFIGMMNDVDKSIDTFDLALRRRFKWIRKNCDYDVIEEETKHNKKSEFSNIDQYVKACKKLNEYISDDLGLGKSYEFGHSFFMKMSDVANRKKITQKNMETLFKLYLHPTLKEYLRAVFSESELDKKLDEAMTEFKETLK